MERPTYPSGRWRGWWQQPRYGRQEMEDFVLRWSDGRIEGEGRDIVGPFRFEGAYDHRGNVTLVKQYLGRHQVVYRGTYDGEGTISGTWVIEPFWSGRFALTPVRSAPPADAPIRDL